MGELSSTVMKGLEGLINGGLIFEVGVGGGAADYISNIYFNFFLKKGFFINIPWVKASCIHAEPTFGAPSLSTQSAFQV